MKVEVIGAKEAGYAIQGKVRIGQEIVIRRKGKVERVIVVRARRYTKTRVTYDNAAVIGKGEASKKIISKGVQVEGKIKI
jgi:hypothetical protein